MNNEATWKIKDVEEAVYDPQIAVTNAIGEITERRSFKEHAKWKIGQFWCISFGIGALALAKFLKFRRSQTRWRS